LDLDHTSPDRSASWYLDPGFGQSPLQAVHEGVHSGGRHPVAEPPADLTTGPSFKEREVKDLEIPLRTPRAHKLSTPGEESRIPFALQQLLLGRST